MTYLIAAIAFVCVVLVVLRAKKAPASPTAADPPPAREAEARDLAEITAGLGDYRRTAYVPVVEQGEGEAAASKFAGSPYLAPGEAWPACGNCGRPMQPFVQLAGDSLPPEAHTRIAPGELFQLFYCTREDPQCEVDCDAWAPRAKSTLLRLVTPVESPGGPPAPEGMFPAARIVGWTAEDDFPNYEELGILGVKLPDVESDTLAEAYPHFGEKLLGWPAWVQGVEYPECRVCGRRMELLFQVDSEKNLPFMFGDVGVAHATQCPEHRTELAFGWACY